MIKSCMMLACVTVILMNMTGAALASIVIGLPPNGDANSFPFGYGYQAEYQQVYTSGAFTGPITITGLQFFNTVANTGATSMNSGLWTISLSTTADWNTLSSTMSANIGADNTVVFSGDLYQPWAFGNTLAITLTTPFTYDPSAGNLLMDVVANASVTSSPIYFDTNNGSVTSRAFYYSGVYGGGSDVSIGYGLVTGFTSVPEPSTFLLLGAGLGGLALLRRKARN